MCGKKREMAKASERASEKGFKKLHFVTLRTTVLLLLFYAHTHTEIFAHSFLFGLRESEAHTKKNCEHDCRWILCTRVCYTDTDTTGVLFICLHIRSLLFLPHSFFCQLSPLPYSGIYTNAPNDDEIKAEVQHEHESKRNRWIDREKIKTKKKRSNCESNNNEMRIEKNYRANCEINK